MQFTQPPFPSGTVFVLFSGVCFAAGAEADFGVEIFYFLHFLVLEVQLQVPDNLRENQLYLDFVVGRDGVKLGTPLVVL